MEFRKFETVKKLTLDSCLSYMSDSIFKSPPVHTLDLLDHISSNNMSRTFNAVPIIINASATFSYPILKHVKYDASVGVGVGLTVNTSR